MRLDRQRHSMDVIEMDAASNNSVDDIRDLRERVAYAPLSGRHKVYILDEAHMLSPQAWNAFLKTLEEPPPRTIFVLATTEAQKVCPPWWTAAIASTSAARAWSRWPRW
jgi:DNA polymerase III, gamma/tau subunits